MQALNIFFILFLTALALSADEYDEDVDEAVIDKLKIEATHDIERLRSFKKEVENNRIFANEREKGLGEYLEDQEKWDLIRERGLREYIKQKKPVADMDENSDEYKTDLKEKQKAQARYESSRENHVRTRNKIHSQIPKSLSALEEEELQIFVDRPRFDIRKKRSNKWVSGAGKSGTMASTPGFQNMAPPPAINDFVQPPPPPDFPAAPAPYEGFEELPPPPMYDSNMNTSVPYDPSFGGEMSIPPPPPPPPDYNF